ncbi:MAG TPA: hypothetical protein DD670_12690 [Planctomycetaceae bacterium]|nr:hypothetical protein [Planctomycetaceae bacterium]
MRRHCSNRRRTFSSLADASPLILLIDHPPGNLARKPTIADRRRGFIHACRKDTEYLSADPAATPFSSLAADQVAALRSLLPDLWLREHPQHLLTERAEELAAATARRRRRRATRRAAVKG